MDNLQHVSLFHVEKISRMVCDRVVGTFNRPRIVFSLLSCLFIKRTK